MPLSAGTRLGPYEIIAPLGAGGMGEVYRARDPRMGREVAIKIAAEQFTERFSREVHAVAALNHPNICHLYDVGPNYLVMELVDGPTLADRIQQGPVPPDEALAIAKQTADALEAAHEKGIVHRDLKPANIKIKPDGTVKVLDFGLAKIADPPEASGAGPEQSPTLTINAATRVGLILGTAAYMSPEQARGKPVDKRADIWAFGVVLYEMLTGEQLFHGETVTDVLAAVVTKEPDWSRVLVRFRRLLRSCLEREPKQRLQAVGDYRLLLEAAPEAAARKQTWIWPPVAAVLLIALAAVSMLYFRRSPPERPVLRSNLLPPEGTAFDFTNGVGLPTLSPDGHKIVFGARTADGKTPLWVRSLDTLAAQPLAGTDGAAFPFWSPDSKFIAFFADAKLKKIDAGGGPAITLTEVPVGRGGSWSRDGIIIFAATNGFTPLLRVSSAGGVASPLSAAAGRAPWFLPDGRHFLYLGFGQRSFAIHVGSLDGKDAMLPVQTSTNAVFSEGQLLFVRDGTLFAQEFDPKRLTTIGEAVPIAEQVHTVLNSGTVGAFTVSQTGLLAFHASNGEGTEVLTWSDRQGKAMGTLDDPSKPALHDMRFSPDHKSIAVAVTEPKGRDLWIYDVSRAVRTRFTFGGGLSPVWSPDGRSIIFASGRKGHADIYRKPSNGSGTEELLYSDDTDKFPTSWSPDGKFLLYTSGTGRTRADVWALPIFPGRPGAPRKPIPIFQTQFNEGYPQFSPDGRWIAYTSDESQRDEIYVASFPPGAGGRRQISTAGGRNPVWRRDGKEIFFLTPERGLMAAEVSLGNGTFALHQVSPLFGPIPEREGPVIYDVSADGERFLFPARSVQRFAGPLTLVQNWEADLKK